MPATGPPQDDPPNPSTMGEALSLGLPPFESAIARAWRKPPPVVADERAPELPFHRSASAEAAAIKLAERGQQ
jgi:hypothetical protein